MFLRLTEQPLLVNISCIKEIYVVFMKVFSHWQLALSLVTVLLYFLPTTAFFTWVWCPNILCKYCVGVLLNNTMSSNNTLTNGFMEINFFKLSYANIVNAMMLQIYFLDKNLQLENQKKL